jgi:ribosomal protein S18 acetylase RimI-like enzyme
MQAHSVGLLEPLGVESAPTLQRLYEECADYFLLTEGQPPGSSAALEEFSARPPGVPPSAKCMFGVRGPDGGFAGLVEGLRDHPQPGTWYLGLLLVRPGARRAGLGAALYREFEALAAAAGATHVRLCVFDVNAAGLRFWQRLGFAFHRAIPVRRSGRLDLARTELAKPIAA